MKFFVNFLSAFRIAAAFAIIPLLMLGMYQTSFALFVLGAISDWLDGFLARKYNVCTKIGGVIDHIGDKLLVCNTLIMLAIMMPVWFIVFPAILMIARELYVSGLREFLGTQKIEMPVPKARFSLGKIKTALQMISITAFLLLFVMGAHITSLSSGRMTMWLISVLPTIGIWGLWISLAASWLSAAGYTRTFVGKLNKKK